MSQDSKWTPGHLDVRTIRRRWPTLTTPVAGVVAQAADQGVEGRFECDGMRIDWDMPIEMDDGIVLRCDVFRPIKKGRYPVLLSHGPDGKWLHF